MIKVTKVEFFINNDDDEPVELDRTEQCSSGFIYVRWTSYGSEIMCAELRVGNRNAVGRYFTGRYYKRIKMYFENGYVWDTLLKEDDEWRRMIYEELQRYVDSDYNDLPGEEHQSEMSRAARLLDDDMIYEI